MSNRFSVPAAALCVGVALLSVTLIGDDSPPAGERYQPPHFLRFPDYGFEPPADEYSGPLFQLSQDYPKTLPDDPDPAFFTIDYRNNSDGQEGWKRYLEAARAYCFEGNIEHDWVVQKNPKRHWYHAPWLHYTNLGREAIHGLTTEATANPGQLAPTQTKPFISVAIGFFNPKGGYTVGQTWEQHYAPDARKARFQHGAVIFKLLFTQATSDQVPYLANDIVWKAYALTDAAKSVTDSTNTARSVQDVRLLQMDVMIRDDRAPAGWLFGTYCYNGMMNRPSKWENLVPVGLQWGNDPTVTDDNTNPKPTRTIINPAIKESIINPNASELPPQHLGWNSRLNGPLDYNASSCMSCHSTAQFPASAPLNPDLVPPGTVPPARGSAEWMLWFRNLPCGDAFSPGSESTDYCLQLSIGITNFSTWWDESQGGLYTSTDQVKGKPRALRKRAPLFLRNIPTPK